MAGPADGRVRTALFLDLDNCLAPATAVGEDLFQPVFDVVRRANHGTLGDAALERAFADCWVHAFDWVAARHGFSPAMRDAGWAAFRELEVRGPLQGYADLPLLATLPARRFLVTSGFRRLQASKVRALGIAPLFEAVCIDAIDEPGRRGKEALFAELLAQHGLAPDEVLVVGDNPESEIAAGNRLGITTVQTLRPGIMRSEAASAHVASLAELARWLTPPKGRQLPVDA